VFYELWDLETRNLVGNFDTQEEALLFVREVLDTYGLEAAKTFALGTEDENGETTAIAQGPALVDLARSLPLGARPSA
jgi:hypothetical protein